MMAIGFHTVRGEAIGHSQMSSNRIIIYHEITETKFRKGYDYDQFSRMENIYRK